MSGGADPPRLLREASPEAGTPQLVRALGVGDSVSLILGIMVGSGIFLMAGSIAAQLSSLAAVIAVWAFGGLLSLWSAMALIHSGSLAALAAAIGLYAGPLLGLGPVGQKLLQLGCLALFVLVNCLGIAFGKWVQNALTGLKIVGIAAMTVALYARGDLQRLSASWRPAGDDS